MASARPSMIHGLPLGAACLRTSAHSRGVIALPAQRLGMGLLFRQFVVGPEARVDDEVFPAVFRHVGEDDHVAADAGRRGRPDRAWGERDRVRRAPRLARLARRHGLDRMTWRRSWPDAGRRLGDDRAAADASAFLDAPAGIDRAFAFFDPPAGIDGTAAGAAFTDAQEA